MIEHKWASECKSVSKSDIVLEHYHTMYSIEVLRMLGISNTPKFNTTVISVLDTIMKFSKLWYVNICIYVHIEY